MKTFEVTEKGDPAIKFQSAKNSKLKSENEQSSSTTSVRIRSNSVAARVDKNWVAINQNLSLLRI